MEEYENYIKNRILELSKMMEKYYSDSDTYLKLKYAKIELEIALSKFELINQL